MFLAEITESLKLIGFICRNSKNVKQQRGYMSADITSKKKIKEKSK